LLYIDALKINCYKNPELIENGSKTVVVQILIYDKEINLTSFIKNEELCNCTVGFSSCKTLILLGISFSKNIHN